MSCVFAVPIERKDDRSNVDLLLTNRLRLLLLVNLKSTSYLSTPITISVIEPCARTPIDRLCTVNCRHADASYTISQNTTFLSSLVSASSILLYFHRTGRIPWKTYVGWKSRSKHNHSRITNASLTCSATRSISGTARIKRRANRRGHGQRSLTSISRGAICAI